MIIYFISSLFLTLILTRISAHLFHDIENYGTKYDKSKTLTAFLRKKTKIDIHHYHLGILILMITLPLIIFKELNKLNIIFLGVGISTITDQLFPLLNKKTNYFQFRSLFISIILHAVIAIIAVLIYQFY